MEKQTELTNEKMNTYYPTNDYCFKRIFGHKGNELITQGLIESILGYKCEVIEVKSDEVTEKDLASDKVGVLDVFVKQKNGTNINLEMQMICYETILKRVLFYWAKKYIENIQSGNKYIELKPTKVILIANFEVNVLYSLQDTISSFKIIEEKERKIILTEDLEIVIIELPKMRKHGTERKDAENWLKFIENPKSLGAKDMEKNKALKRAKEEYDKILADEHERSLLQLREKYIMDFNTLREESLERGKREGYETGQKEGYEAGQKEGYEAGQKEGMERGQKEKAFEIAKKLLSKGETIEKIADVTGLAMEDIKRIQNK